MIRIVVMDFAIVRMGPMKPTVPLYDQINATMNDNFNVRLPRCVFPVLGTVTRRMTVRIAATNRPIATKQSALRVISSAITDSALSSRGFVTDAMTVVRLMAVSIINEPTKIDLFSR